MTRWRTFREDVACGAGLLTRLPLGWLGVSGQAWSLTRSVWCWPLIGAFIGIVTAGVLVALRFLHCPLILAAVWSIGAQLLLTGGLHEDGLADMADGCGGGQTRERRLDIMRDSRIGSYGALALGICLMIRIAALSEIPTALAIPFLALSGTLSRAILPLLPFTLPPARTNGLAQQLAGLTRNQTLTCFFLAFCIAVVCVPAGTAFFACFLALCVALILRKTALRLLGGYTGDVLGATACLTDCALLTTLAALTNS